MVGLFFQYIHMLRTEGPQEWVFDEVAAVKEIEFKFQEEEEADDYVVSDVGVGGCWGRFDGLGGTVGNGFRVWLQGRWSGAMMVN